MESLLDHGRAYLHPSIRAASVDSDSEYPETIRNGITPGASEGHDIGTPRTPSIHHVVGMPSRQSSGTKNSRQSSGTKPHGQPNRWISTRRVAVAHTAGSTMQMEVPLLPKTWQRSPCPVRPHLSTNLLLRPVRILSEVMTGPLYEGHRFLSPPYPSPLTQSLEKGKSFVHVISWSHQGNQGGNQFTST